MAVTDLTNTKWLFKGDYSVDIATNFDYSINFTSNNETFARIFRGSTRYEGDTTVALFYGTTPVYVYSWSNYNEAYRTIEITGGTDVTNASLISWLTANAIQTTVTNLTNTKWLINSTNCAGGYGQFNINYNVYDPGSGTVIGQDSQLFVGYRWNPQQEAFVPQANVVMSPMSIIVIQADMTIEIIDGTDVTNTSLIYWLASNATQIQGSSLENTKWRFKDIPDLSSFPAAGTSYSINFTSNSNNYTLLKLATYAITYNTTEVYTGSVPLVAPSIALSSDELSITDNDGNATGFKVYWDGSTTVAETISKT